MNITITMDISRIEDTKQLADITSTLAPVVDTVPAETSQADIAKRYAAIEGIARKFGYARKNVGKKARAEIITMCMQATGLSRSRVKHLLRIFVKHKGRLTYTLGTKHTFKQVYTTQDVALLASADNAFLRMSGNAMVHVFRRMYEVHADEAYARLAHLSVSHLYNLRETRQYQSNTLTVSGTKRVTVPIGKRMKPNHGGHAGYIRVDTVHQGDLGKVKGVYYINLVDEVTQWEVVACVPDISEYFLESVLEAALLLFPFRISGFHSDNGGEYINKTVAALLRKLHARQTKSRSRKTNDNALVEGKNAAVVRKHFGHAHIPKGHADEIDAFAKQWLVPFLNFHRPCAFATEEVDEKTGKIVKKYDTYLTPFEKLCSLPEEKRNLNPSVTLDDLRAVERAHSDIEFATLKEKARDALFKKLS